MSKRKSFTIGLALARGLEETIESAQNHSGELRVEVLPLSKVETDPDNPRDLSLKFEDISNGIVANDIDHTRKTSELESLQSLASSIKTQGIINPITVYKHGDKYRLIAGERRTLASILAGKTDIQARILDNKPDELRVSLLQWIENIERSDLSLWERLKNLEKIVLAHAKAKKTPAESITVTQLSQLIGCSKPHAMNYKAILDADDEIRGLIHANKIKNLEKVALIAGIESKEARAGAIEACINGATLKQLKALSAQAIAKPVTSKITETRGRHTTAIQFGTTKNVNVAKTILDSVLKNQSMSQLSQHFQGIDWTNHRSVAEAFKKLLKKLEELHA
jgi:ParB family chromosome partitioning protein